MLSTHSISPRRPSVMVRFGDGTHSFMLPEGATLSELANRIDVLGAQHQRAPISVHVHVDRQCAPPMSVNLSRKITSA
jgi:hypothetical protein